MHGMLVWERLEKKAMHEPIADVRRQVAAAMATTTAQDLLDRPDLLAGVGDLVAKFGSDGGVMDKCRVFDWSPWAQVASRVRELPFTGHTAVHVAAAWKYLCDNTVRDFTMELWSSLPREALREALVCMCDDKPVGHYKVQRAMHMLVDMGTDSVQCMVLDILESLFDTTSVCDAAHVYFAGNLMHNAKCKDHVRARAHVYRGLVLRTRAAARGDKSKTGSLRHSWTVLQEELGAAL